MPRMQKEQAPCAAAAAEQQPAGPDEDALCEDVMEGGRLSAILPRKLFQDDAAVKSGLLQVYVRVKPLPASTPTCLALDQPGGRLLRASWRNSEAVYKFSSVFDQSADQTAVYDGAAAALVRDCIELRQPSAVIMAYGVTSAGKTHTMIGTSARPGLVPRALQAIFQALGERGSAPRSVTISVCEIYNETINDLLHVAAAAGPAAAALHGGGGGGVSNRPPAGGLRLKEDKDGRMSVQGACEAPVQSVAEAAELLRRAARARQCAGTSLNEHSSRSHAVITIKVQAAGGHSDGSGGTEESRLHFVDLAGCERVKRTGNSGARLRESVAINSSLMTLARCLEVLRYNQQHPGDARVIPFRESKITHLFKDVLHGRGRFVMLVNVSPATEAFNETRRVLQYAALASKVTMTSEVELELAAAAAAAAAGGGAPRLLPPEDAGGAPAATDNGAAAAAALAAAHERIEQLLDDKADLEYEVEVVDKKVELLREELIKCELEKEQLETDLRAELAAEAQALLQEQRAATERAEEQAAMWRARAEELAGKLAAHDAAAAAVAEAALQQEAARIAQAAIDAHVHAEQIQALKAQLSHAQEELLDARQHLAAGHRQAQKRQQRHQQQLPQPGDSVTRTHSKQTCEVEQQQQDEEAALPPALASHIDAAAEDQSVCVTNTAANNVSAGGGAGKGSTGTAGARATAKTAAAGKRRRGAAAATATAAHIITEDRPAQQLEQPATTMQLAEPPADLPPAAADQQQQPQQQQQQPARKRQRVAQKHNTKPKSPPGSTATHKVTAAGELGDEMQPQAQQVLRDVTSSRQQLQSSCNNSCMAGQLGGTSSSQKSNMAGTKGVRSSADHEELPTSKPQAKHVTPVARRTRHRAVR